MKIMDLIEQDDEFTRQVAKPEELSPQEQVRYYQRVLTVLEKHQDRVLRVLQELVSTPTKKLDRFSGLWGGLLIFSYDSQYKALEASSPYKGKVCSNEFDRNFRADHISVSDYLIDPATPNITKNWPRIKSLTDKTVQYATQYKKASKAFKAAKKAERVDIKSTVHVVGSAASAADIKKLQKTLPEIYVGKRKIQNPLVTCDLSLYAGPPEKYPDLTPTQFDLLMTIQKALKAAGRPTLTMMYAGRLHKDYKAINFVAVTADNKIAWRKYDTSPGSGQNWFYYDDGKGGTKINTSWFVSDPAKYLAAVV